tara:strand:+ start:297 stop:458 length:162 start_codon:yes stop_codon:yes gene_type:complete
MVVALVVTVEVEEVGVLHRLQQLEQPILVAVVVVIKKITHTQLRSEEVRALLY